MSVILSKHETLRIERDDALARVKELELVNEGLLQACEYAFENLKPQGDVRKDFSGHNACAALSKAIHKAKEVK